MQDHHETTATIVAKTALPFGVTMSSIAGYPVHEVVAWATLIYTTLLICHKVWVMYKDIVLKDD
jgi:hypothetical protein